MRSLNGIGTPGGGPIAIDDPDDPRLADYVGLTDRDLRRRVEFGGERGIFIAEGVLVIGELLRSPYPVRSLLLTPARHAQLEPVLAGLQAPVYVAEHRVMKHVTGFDIHRGAVGAAERLALPALADLLRGRHRIAMLEGINDHENLGVLFRNASAFGVEAVVLDPTCADPLYRRSVRVSMGHALRVPFGRAEPWPAALQTVVDAGFDVVALTPSVSARPVEELDRYREAGRVAILVGAEGPGLSQAVLNAATFACRIGMAPGVDSLNVAAAAAVAFHRAAGPA
ncbi:MAG: RNA methyltransferase [Acidimicrobiales bacterium]